MADDIKISADWLDDDSSVDGEAALQDPARSPDTYDIYEPTETYTPPLDTPSGVEEAVARLAPASPSVRTDGLQAVLRERRQRARRPLLDGWAVLTADTTMPSGLAVRFTDQFPEVDAERIGLVWDAFLQWLRIEGRNHPRRHGMPSRSVDALLNMLRSDSDSWDDLRREWPVNLDYLFVLHRGLWLPGDDLDPLRATWSDAFNDEPPKSQTPLLFRVDADVGIADARTYQACCQGRGCNPPARVICLHAL